MEDAGENAKFPKSPQVIIHHQLLCFAMWQVVLLPPPWKVVYLSPVGSLVSVNDQAHCGCVFGKLQDQVWLMCRNTIVCVHGMEERAQDTVLVRFLIKPVLTTWRQPAKRSRIGTGHGGNGWGTNEGSFSRSCWWTQTLHRINSAHLVVRLRHAAQLGFIYAIWYGMIQYDIV